MTQQSLSSRAWAELILLSVIWGASFVSIRIALDEIGFLTSVAHRLGWAALVLWAVVLWRGHAVPRTLALWGAFFVMGLLNNVVPFALMAWGQLYIESGLISIFNAATAVFGVLVAAALFADERLSARKATGVVLGFLGVAIAIGLEALARFDPRSVAQLAVLAGALSYALAGAWARVHLAGLAPEVAAAGMLTASTLIILPVTIAYEGVPSLALEADTLAAIAYFSLLSTALAYLLYYRVLAMAGSGNLLLCTLMITPVAILLGAWIRDEALEPRAFIGLGVLVVGLLVLDGRLVRRIVPAWPRG